MEIEEIKKREIKTGLILLQTLNTFEKQLIRFSSPCHSVVETYVRWILFLRGAGAVSIHLAACPCLFMRRYLLPFL